MYIIQNHTFSQNRQKMRNDITCFSSMDLLLATIKKDKGTDIYTILENRGDKVDTMEIIRGDEAFALYHVSGKEEDDYTDPRRCIGYSYGNNYNTHNEDDPLSPKTFFLEKGPEIIEYRLIGNNIVVRSVGKKDLGRDSYYPNMNQYVTNHDDKSILRAIADLDKYKIWIGENIDWNSDINMMEANTILNKFSEKTKIKGNYAYYPIQEITLDQLLEESFSIDKIIQEQRSSQKNKLGKENLQEIEKIWYR